jgi:hypothetical protein
MPFLGERFGLVHEMHGDGSPMPAFQPSGMAAGSSDTEDEPETLGGG